MAAKSTAAKYQNIPGTRRAPGIIDSNDRYLKWPTAIDCPPRGTDVSVDGQYLALTRHSLFRINVPVLCRPFLDGCPVKVKEGRQRPILTRKSSCLFVCLLHCKRAAALHHHSCARAGTIVVLCPDPDQKRPAWMVRCGVVVLGGTIGRCYAGQIYVPYASSEPGLG